MASLSIPVPKIIIDFLHLILPAAYVEWWINLLHENPTHQTGDSKDKVINAYDNVIANGENNNDHHLLDVKGSHIDAQVHQIDKSLVFSQNKVNVNDRES